MDSNEWQYYEATVMDLNKVEAPIEFQVSNVTIVT